MLNLLYFIIVLSILIFAHELAIFSLPASQE